MSAGYDLPLTGFDDDELAKMVLVESLANVLVGYGVAVVNTPV